MSTSAESERDWQDLSDKSRPIYVRLLGAVPVPKVVLVSAVAYFLFSVPLIGISLLYTHLAFRNSVQVEASVDRQIDKMESSVGKQIDELEDYVDESVAGAKAESIKRFEWLKIDVDNNSNFRRYHLREGGTPDGPHPQEKDRMLRDAESHADPVEGEGHG